MQLTYEFKGEQVKIRLDKQADGSFIATIGDEIITFNATELANGTWLLDSNGQRHMLHTASQQSMRYVQVDGTQYQLEKATGRRRRSRQAGVVGDLTSEMPGQVIEVRVAEGDSVQSGDVLVVLEAMKMEIRITAPYDGIVARLMVAQGDVVDRGQNLVEVTES
ncbi:MAG: acetyl-CoA carboxylase biotin carboxyl carrier protein subunit [Phototrophicaceae bacterium]